MVVDLRSLNEEGSITNLTDAQRQDAAISLAEAALRKKRWTENTRRQMLRTSLEALGLILPKESA